MVPQEKRERLVASINGVLPCHTVCAWVLAGIVGQVISMSLAIGPIACLCTRALYQVINSRRFWADKLMLSVDACEELRFWKSSLEAFNGQPIWFSRGITRIMYSDASSSGYGGYHKVEVGAEVAHGQWSSYEASLSSSKVTAPQDAHGGLVLQVYLGSNTLEFSAIRR